MENLYLFHDSLADSFRIDYPWYGLFRSTKVQIINEIQNLYHCQLHNDSILKLQKLTTGKWIDIEAQQETSLSGIIGEYIETYLKK